jgi:hypothetical protein
MACKFGQLFIGFIFFQYAFAETETHLYFLKSGSILYNQKKGAIKINKGIYVKGHEINGKTKSEFQILDKANNPAYLVNANDLIDVEDDLNILPTQSFKDLGEIVAPKLDKKVELAFSVTILKDTLTLKELNDYFQTNATSIESPRLKINSTYNTDLMLDFGANLNFQNGSWSENNLKEGYYSSLTLGPVVSLKLINDNTFGLKINLNYDFSIDERLNYGGDKQVFSSHIWLLVPTLNINSDYGTFLFDFEYRNHRSTLKSPLSEAKLVYPREYNYSSIGLGIGYQVKINL